jgi:hypothetical protein
MKFMVTSTIRTCTYIVLLVAISLVLTSYSILHAAYIEKIRDEPRL